MNKQLLIYSLLFFVLISTLTAQEKKKIEIKYAGRLNVDEEKYPGARILTRDESQQVHIGHESIDLWCDRAIHYGSENFIEAYGNVKMKQADTVNMTSKYIEYSGITQLALARGEVVLTDPNTTVSSDTIYFDRLKQEAFYRSGGTVVKDTTVTITSKIGRHYMQENKMKFIEDVVMVSDSSTIKSNYFDYFSDTGHAYLFGPSTITTPESKTYCEKGFYDTENETGYVLKNARIDYDDRIIEGDSLYMDNAKSFASATNNIKVTDTLNHSIIKGHYAEVYRGEEKDSVFITKKALAITVQEKDSIYIHADKIMVTGKPEHRIVKAYYKAKIYKSDLCGKSDSIHSDQQTGITKLINIDKFKSSDRFSTLRKPIMWNLENQMTGDTIHLISNPESEKIDSLLVFENAFIISKDTIAENNYNQINGMHLRGLFNEENQLRQVDITRNAQSIFYARNEEQELIGIDKAKSGSISILFDQGAIEEYTRLNQVDGTLTPQSQFPDRDKILKGFDWREEERLTSVDDLFKDDPPLELPIIKGLEDYVPPKEFFDEDLIERINKAGSRASENIIIDNVEKKKLSTKAEVKNITSVERVKDIFKVTVTALVKKEDSFQLFYTKNNTSNFTEPNSVIKKFKGKESFQKIEFELPKGTVAEKLRLDIGTNRKQNTVKIKSILISYKNKEIFIPGRLIKKYFKPNHYISLNSNSLLYNLKEVEVNGKRKYDPSFVCNNDLVNLIKKLK